MTHEHDDDRDPVLAELFRAADAPLADAGFSAAVLRRVQRLERIRHGVLALAAAAGIALALVPASQLVLDCTRQLAVVSQVWSDALQERLTG